MKRILCYGLAVLLFLSFSGIQSAKKEPTVSDSSLLTLDRIFNTEDFNSQRMGRMVWLEKGGTYTTMEKSSQPDAPETTKETQKKKPLMDIVRYNPRSGKRTVEINGALFVPDGASEPLRIKDYSWSDDGVWLLLFTNTKRVWREETRGDYWVLNLKTKALWKLGADADESSLMFAKFSPDSKRVGYVYKNNIFIQNLGATPEQQSILQLTGDGSRTIINGTSDWVYEEEFGLRDCFIWSPDSTHIAYWQFDSDGVQDFYMINNTDSLYPKLIPVQYPKAGTTNSACKVGVISANGGKTVWFSVEGDPRQHYIPRMDWASGSKEVVFQRLNRLQNTKVVMLGDIATGAVRSILTETDAAWVEVDNNLKWMDNGTYFTWVSERSGWRHIYLVSRDGKDVKPVTSGNYDVTGVLKIDTKKGWVYFTASPDNPLQSFLYRVSLKRGGKAERLTPKGVGGSHRYTISGDGKWAFHTYSSFDKLPVTELVALPSHKSIRVFVDSKSAQANLDGLKRGPWEFFKIPIEEGVALDAFSIKPPDFDAAKKYPLLFHVYGEPAGRTVLDQWGRTNYLWHLMLAQQGYIIISIDNRGTPGPKGRAWRKCIYGEVGVMASADQAAALKVLLNERPYIDGDRVGIWGWSGGGSMTLNMLFRFPELYKTGISIAPVPNQRYYDSIYQERYMGLPEQNKEGYEKGSPVTYAQQLEGNLLVIHGTGDDNVHYQGTEELINKLIEHGRQFSMMAYPNRSHGIYEGEGTRIHLYTLMTRYLNANLHPGPLPRR